MSPSLMKSSPGIIGLTSWSRSRRVLAAKGRPIGKREHVEHDDVEERNEDDQAPPAAIAGLLQNLDHGNEIQNSQDRDDDQPMENCETAHDFLLHRSWWAP